MCLNLVFLKNILIELIILNLCFKMIKTKQDLYCNFTLPRDKSVTESLHLNDCSTT